MILDVDNWHKNAIKHWNIKLGKSKWKIEMLWEMQKKKGKNIIKIAPKF